MEEFKYSFAAGPEDIKAAFGIRREVFIIGQNIPEEIEMDGQDSKALHVIVRNGDRVIATARVRFPAENTAKIERMAVLSDYRGRGAGAGIISFLMEEFNRRRITDVMLHAQQAVAGFYRSCGFTETGEPFIEAGISHIEMEKKL